MKLSIITPVYNRCDCIKRCLDSVRSQLDETYDIEHVVVDDGSTDDTTAIILEYKANNTYLKTIFFEQNRGTNAARNAAINNATGDFCMILDSDDYLAENAIATLFDVFKAYPTYRYYMFTRDDRRKEFDEIYGVGFIGEYKYIDALNGNIRGDYIHVIDRNLLLEFPFDEQLRIYESLVMQQIYRKVQKMLFVNYTMVIAERDRFDSVSMHTVRVSVTSIQRELYAAIKEVDLFGADYKRYGCDYKYMLRHFIVADNALLLGDYSLASKYLSMVTGFRFYILKTIQLFRLGSIYRKLLQIYLLFKYRKYILLTK